MKPFALTAVLKYRKQLEDTAVLKLSKAQLELQNVEQRLRVKQEEYSALTAECDLYQAEGIGIEDLLRYENRISWLKIKLHEIAVEHQRTLEKVKKKRDNVLVRSRNRKVLERLKIKQNSEWQTYLSKRENAQLDEIAVLSHERNQLENK